MKERRTESARVYLGVICHTAILDEVKAMLEAKGCAIREGKKNYTIEEVFPDFHAGHSLRGARYREDVSQRRLAKLTGVSVQNISAMENGRRPIGKDTAKRFAGVLNTDWRLLLS
jgi:DNA-binding XRE family transcriptional regulator